MKISVYKATKMFVIYVDGIQRFHTPIDLITENEEMFSFKESEASTVCIYKRNLAQIAFQNLEHLNPNK